MVAARAPHRRSWLRVRDWRVRTKLGVVLVIPTLALLMVGGVQIRAQVDEAGRLSDFADQVGLGRQVCALAHELAGERDRTVGELAAFESGGRPGDPGELSDAVRDQRAAVDRAAVALRRAGAGVSGGAAWRSAYARVLVRLDALGSTRSGITSGTLARRAAHDVYGRTIGALLSLLAVPSPGADHAELDRLRSGYVELARLKEVTSQLRSRIFAVGQAGGFAAGDFVEIADLRAQRLSTLVRFRSVAPASQVDRYDVAMSGALLTRANQIEQAVVDSAGRSDLRLDGEQWWHSSSDQLNRVRAVEAELIADAADRAAQRRDRHHRQTWLVAGGLAVAVAAALVMSLIIGRSMARSLRLLRRDALQVAQVELPKVLERLAGQRGDVPDIEVRPTSVRTADEVGEVAEAFTAVHASAVALAREQAAMRRNVNTMFVNLARRSQVLVERQLELLDQMESQQQDPDVLAGLFRLDHLAARMRRNDESLVVLAGNDNVRRRHAPLPVSAAMLAAIAEVEQYTRIRHHADDTWYVVGHAAADVVHLLAELLENATAFSPPSTMVEVTGGVVGGQVLIEITDAGIGMSPAGLDEANALLERPPAVDVGASERMGLFVVSHLAARLDVRVRLRAGERGLVASVWLPPELLSPAPEVAEAAPERVVRSVPGPRALPAGPAGAPVGVGAPSGASTGSRAVAVRREALVAGVASGRRVALPPLPPLPPVDLVLTGRLPAGRVAGRVTPALPAGRPAGSTWWTRGAAADAATGAAAAPILPTPPEVPVTGGLTDRGLPMRVPMAQLPPEAAQASPLGAGGGGEPGGGRVDEPDPESVGSTLARFYSGVRRAEAEDWTQRPAASVGRGEEERQ